MSPRRASRPAARSFWWAGALIGAAASAAAAGTAIEASFPAVSRRCVVSVEAGDERRPCFRFVLEAARHEGQWAEVRRREVGEAVCWTARMGPPHEDLGAEFVFEDGLAAVQPVPSPGKIVVEGAFAFALIPNFIGDDLVYDPNRAGMLEELYVPAEHALVLFEARRDAVVTLCWRSGAAPSVVLETDAPHAEPRRIRAVRVGAVERLYAGLTYAPGAWHAVRVEQAWYEQAHELAWRPPFDADWLVQLAFQNHALSDWRHPPPLDVSDCIAGTWSFSATTRKTWRETVGFYPWPAQRRDGAMALRIGQKVLPAAADTLVYALERTDAASADVCLPMDWIGAALGEEETARRFDFAGRGRFDLHRADAVYGEPTCGTTDHLLAIFEAGGEAEQADTIRRAADDLLHYLTRMRARLACFEAFAAQARAVADRVRREQPELEAYLDDIGWEEAADEIETVCRRGPVAGLPDDARPIIEELKALAGTVRPDHVASFKRIKAFIIHRGAMVDSTAARFDFLLRGLAQRAGYRCIDNPAAARVAAELRRCISAHLRRPTPWEQQRPPR